MSSDISPRQFLKERRPEKFSDSISIEVPALDRSLLEYHLDTLTSRGQENDFENFARRLVEKEICPNLLPHTGPTGGGDSKVDAETYPVADSLSLAWFVGAGNESASERWAFAFSAKKKWRPKLNADVDKVISTGRDYKKCFFVTNQFISDRVRAEVEDCQRKKHGIDVRVLDRTWILDRVFSNKREALAIAELRIHTEVRTQRRLGPHDLEREQELDGHDRKIELAISSGEYNPVLVEDCARSVELARSLERPRTEVEGRLLRLKRLTERCGTPHQKLFAEYVWAWTAFWWFEDYVVFVEHYIEVEKRVKDTTNVYQVELLFNLWCGLRMAATAGKLPPHDINLEQRTRILRLELERLAQHRERLSSSLQAQAMTVLMDLLLVRSEAVDDLLKKMTEVIDQSLGLIGFPFEPLIQILTELGRVFGDRPSYEELSDKLIKAVELRTGDIAAARLLVQRAAHALDNGRPHAAIQSSGRALARLYKHETRHELVEALYICGNAYEQVGLTWAARGALLSAASVAINEFWTYEEVTHAQALCFGTLQWLELRLGRLPHLLAWHQTTLAVEAVLHHHGADGTRAIERTIWFDTCLAILVLKADLRQLRELTRLPDVLVRLELSLSAAALRFALGHEYELPAEFETATTQGDSFFLKLSEQPAANQMADSPDLCCQQNVEWESRVLGCNVIVKAQNRSPCLELAESLLAALEASLATGVEYGFFAHEAKIKINIHQSDFASFPFRFEFKHEHGLPFIDITVANFHPHKIERQLQHQLQDKVTELLAETIARFFILEYDEERLKFFIGDEEALQRAVNFSSSFVNLGNVLGHSPHTSLDSWLNQGGAEYPLLRSELWRVGLASGDRSMPQAIHPQNNEEIRERDDWKANARHDEMETVSLIRMPLWEKARWAGVAYLFDRKGEFPPAIALLFGNAVAGREIFAQWKRELGEVDEHGRLRLSIIRGISKSKPYAYRVTVGANLRIDETTKNPLKRFAMISRIHTMEPSSDVNVRGFLDCYRKVKYYGFMPAQLNGTESDPELFHEDAIVIRDIHVREAWEIGPNDFEVTALFPDDDPVIPAEIKDPPVVQALEWLRRMHTT